MDPLELNTQTGEPYLRLPAPFANIIITPPRPTDVAPSVAIMNDPAVFAWMGRTTLYTPCIAAKWIAKVTAETDAALHELQAGARVVGGCPVRHLRELCADGTDVFIGDVGLTRSTWAEIRDEGERARCVAENNVRAPGDSGISWNVGYYLAPSHHGRGLMTAAVGAIIQQWGFPRMRTTRIRSSAFVGNHGSVKVLEKNGFVIVDTLVDHVDVGKDKKSLHIFEWNVTN
ncbi:acyl-CoA N-acyltransferase [Mycena sp. CBHHK59/15]|nr:acyl-CoA N-acyltransferase [Mycena sp. CBHHK59/15]